MSETEKVLMDEMADCIEKLASYLKESHEEEVEEDHYGDDPASCTYCMSLDEGTLVTAKYHALKSA